MIRIGGAPVKTRVPLGIWALAVVLALFSVASSATQFLPGHSEPGLGQKALHAGSH
jgi:hypothetical protein